MGTMRKNDFYALGITFYCLLTGHVPPTSTYSREELKPTSVWAQVHSTALVRLRIILQNRSNWTVSEISTTIKMIETYMYQ